MMKPIYSSSGSSAVFWIKILTDINLFFHFVHVSIMDRGFEIEVFASDNLKPCDSFDY